MRVCKVFLFLFGTLASIMLTAQSNEKRIALVIGVKDYQFVPPLQNTLNDAMDMSANLKAKGFQVVELYNPKTKRQMQDAILQYFQLLKGNAVGMVYYSGHGLQVDGMNYLIPVSADPKIKADLEDQCLNMEYVMSAIAEAGNSLNIFVLDACRNNPFKGFTRSTEKGLTMVSAPRGSYIVYATKPGSVASDGTGRNGLFTSKLLKYMNSSGLNIEQVFKKVAADVSADSDNDQRPWIASDYTGDFFFTPGNNRTEIHPTSTVRKAETVFSESFSDNENKWFTQETNDYSFKVSDGKYEIKSKKGGSWFCTLPIEFNDEGDYEIAATLTKKSGTDGYYFGVVLGFDIETKYHHFMGVTGWGNYVLANKGPAFANIIDSKENSIVQRGNSSNYIVLKKISNQFRLFINGKLMGEVPAEQFFGSYFGFQIWSGNEDLTIEVDNFSIKTFN